MTSPTFSELANSLSKENLANPEQLFSIISHLFERVSKLEVKLVEKEAEINHL